MKFRDVSERVKGGKLDPLSKMGKSKLTGQEIAKYYKDNPKAKQAARDKTVKKAIELALDLGGAQSYAIKEIEKLKRGLSKMPVVQQALRTANESVNEGVSVYDERIVNKGKGIIIMIDDNGKKVSAIFKDKKNADKFNRNKPSDVKKLLKLAKSKKYPKAIDENEMTSTSSVAMPEIPLGRKHKVMKRKELEKESINEETILYRIKDIQKPELDKFKSSARLMKLKINIKQSPMKKDTLIRLQGSKKQINDFDAVVRGKSSYGDPSLAMKEDFDLLEKQFAIKPDMDWTATFSPKYRGKMRKTKTSYGVDKEDVVAMIRKKKDGKHKIKDGNTSLIVRSLARIMNQDRKKARDKGAEFGKGEPKDEMDAPKIKKMIDIVSKGITVTKKGDKITRNASDVNAFYNVDTAIRDDVYKVINMASDGTLSSLVYEGTELNEESATMKKVRQVIKKKGMMNIDGMKLDLTTASMIASVYDKVNPMNKKRMDKLKLPQLVNLTMKVAGKGKMKKEDAVERAKELADLKAKHKREIEQEKDEIAATKQTNESLWRNIHNKRKRGEKMRKPGEKGAPTAQDFKNARGEAVSPAQQAAIAISKKERGEKPKNECADEKDFKPHMMYDPKTGKGVMANKYADHVKYDKMGYTHEKPKKEALDAKDKPFVKDLIKKLRGGSKTHAKQADDLEKAMNTESMSRARRDAMRDMGTRKDRDDDGNPVATADDRKAADKNVVMQIRRVTDLSKPAQIELRNGKKVMLKPADAKMMMKKFDAIRKPQDRLKVQNAMNDKKMTVQGLKRLLGR